MEAVARPAAPSQAARGAGARFRVERFSRPQLRRGIARSAAVYNPRERKPNADESLAIAAIGLSRRRPHPHRRALALLRG
jgi:hypothetical protein